MYQNGKLATHNACTPYQPATAYCIGLVHEVATRALACDEAWSG
jgi:hypothetical protein